eukprot:TRINITY_DN19377_c0_g1_i1.p1 TRINITY_DN19377_c0_g1~~TRINITY_DN19377_c0_g1_i1.p1  ORF type:complete len:281 (-),score=93.20 TRINITY_DN19377_c0_g1_i1:451-1293(-)
MGWSEFFVRSSLSVRRSYAWAASYVVAIVSLVTQLNHTKQPQYVGLRADAEPTTKAGNTDPGFCASSTSVHSSPAANHSALLRRAAHQQQPHAVRHPPPPLSGPLHKKILVLDLDETLVHATTRPMAKQPCDMVVRVSVEGVSCVFYVSKRPHVDHFIRTVSQWFEVIVFTASLSQYADPVIDVLDPRRLIKRRFFRESCVQRNGSYVKNLHSIYHDLSQVVIIDNSPAAYSLNRENAIPIADWLGDNAQDEALLTMLPFLNALRHISDVRSILSLRLKQ